MGTHRHSSTHSSAFILSHRYSSTHSSTSMGIISIGDQVGQHYSHLLHLRRFLILPGIGIVASSSVAIHCRQSDTLRQPYCTPLATKKIISQSLANPLQIPLALLTFVYPACFSIVCIRIGFGVGGSLCLCIVHCGCSDHLWQCYHMSVASRRRRRRQQ